MSRYPRAVAIPMLALASVLTACGGDDGPAESAPPEELQGSPDAAGNTEVALDFTAFDEAMTQFIIDQDLRGASAVLVDRERGVVYTEGYGEFAEDRQYLVMSSSKILSVGVLMRLADEGLLDVDAPIGDYVSAWGAGKPELTVAQLVSGSSGMVGILDDLLYAPYLCQFDAAAVLEECATAIYAADDAATRLAPDSEFHYGGAPWQLAGGVAEVVGGKSWAELFDETYADCDVPSMGYANPSALGALTPNPDGSIDIAGVSYPPTVDGDMSTVPETQNPLIEGGLFTNVADYGKILLMHLRGGMCEDTRVLSEEAVEKMQTDRLAAYGGDTAAQMEIILTGADQASLDSGLDLAGYGMGWWVNRAEPGILADPGAYGANAWLDLERGYGGFIAVEGKVKHAADMVAAGVIDAAEAAFDAAAP